MKKIYIMTDAEGVAGVMNSLDWCYANGRYFDVCRELLTFEVNAAIEGFAAAGAVEFLVHDGHGGAIDPLRLDERAELMRGMPQGYPYLLDRTFDAIAWVGQHAMSRTEYAHLAHTGSMAKFEYTINGTPVGEFGQLAMCASELGVRSIFGSGDRAFCSEAGALVPGIEAVEVKRGITPGRGDECDAAQYAARNTSAIHIHPVRARKLIRAGAERAVRRAAGEPFGIIPLKPPFEMIKHYRPNGANPATTLTGSHPTSIIALLKAIPIDPPRVDKGKS
ncbi:MAG: M55 family metallopeptidase [Lentisphaerae bacterium]|nr:M55 family metallopeptidase [Lentisphaerota bacterium]